MDGKGGRGRPNREWIDDMVQKELDYNLHETENCGNKR